MIKLLAILLVLLPTATAWAKLPTQAAYPGGIAVVNLTLNGGSEKPRATFNQRQVLVRRLDGQWAAIVGLPLRIKPGIKTITVAHSDKQQKISFQVFDRKYKTQHITLKNKRMVDPTAEDMIRIRKERKRIDGALETYSYDKTANLDFVLPVEGHISDSYGKRRFFNKQPRKPHSGMDISAPEGTVIRNPAAGIVVETGHYFFNGKTIFIDHGEGLVTMYCHLNSIDVKPGDNLDQGEIFATVGSTGRVTGPHLHWGVALNRAMIDPGLLLNLESK